MIDGKKYDYQKLIDEERKSSMMKSSTLDPKKAVVDDLLKEDDFELGDLQGVAKNGGLMRRNSDFEETTPVYVQDKYDSFTEIDSDEEDIEDLDKEVAFIQKLVFGRSPFSTDDSEFEQYQKFVSRREWRVV